MWKEQPMCSVWRKFSHVQQGKNSREAAPLWHTVPLERNRGFPECLNIIPECYGKNPNGSINLTICKYSRIRPNQSCPYGQAHKPRHIVNFQAFHQLGTMGFDGFHTQIQPVSDLLCRAALSD